MKYYVTQQGKEFIQEHKGGGEAYDAMKKANAPVTAPKSKEVTSTSREGDATPTQQTVLGRGTKKAKVHPMRRLGQILGKMARISGSAPQSVDPTRRR